MHLALEPGEQLGICACMGRRVRGLRLVGYISLGPHESAIAIITSAACRPRARRDNSPRGGGVGIAPSSSSRSPGTRPRAGQRPDGAARLGDLFPRCRNGSGSSRVLDDHRDVVARTRRSPRRRGEIFRPSKTTSPRRYAPAATIRMNGQTRHRLSAPDSPRAPTFCPDRATATPSTAWATHATYREGPHVADFQKLPILEFD